MLKRICFFIIFVTFSECEDSSFFIAKQYHLGQFYCVTNSSYALAWVEADTTQLFHQVHQFENQTIWKLKCTHPPSCTRQFQKSISEEVIFDRRWEDLPTHTSKLVEFTPIFNKLEDNFVIPLSIRIEKDAHIFLCNASSVSRSECYWLLLHAYDGQITSLRKCSFGAVFSDKDIFSQCSKNLVLRYHGHCPSFLTSEKWTHFILSKNENRLSFKKISSTEETILEYEDPEFEYNVTHMIVHSRSSFGLWKIHEVEFYHTEEEVENVKISDFINVTQGSVCISLFIKTCWSCKVRLELRSIDDASVATRTFHGGIYWQEIKFVVTNINTPQVDLMISTLCNSMNQINRYWSIGSLEYCNVNGFRMIESDRNANCQLISKTSKLVISSEGNDVSEEDYFIPNIKSKFYTKSMKECLNKYFGCSTLSIPVVILLVALILTLIVIIAYVKKICCQHHSVDNENSDQVEQPLSLERAKNHEKYQLTLIQKSRR